MKKEKVHDKAFENTIDINRFDVLAAGFELERRRIKKGITARIPTAVLQGIASHEGIKVNSNYRPTTV